MTYDSAYTTPAHRSRLWNGNTFFRSIDQNQYVNALSISVTGNSGYFFTTAEMYNVELNEPISTISGIPTGVITLTVSYSGEVQEIYTATQTVSGGYITDTLGIQYYGININSAIPTFRQLINISFPGTLNYDVFTNITPLTKTVTNPISGSSFISMPPRQYDNFDSSNDGLYIDIFNSSLTGGEGPTSNTEFINNIPMWKYKVLILETIEDLNGYPITVIPYPQKAFMWNPYQENWSSLQSTGM